MTARANTTQLLLWCAMMVLLVLLVTPITWVLFSSFKDNTDIMNHPFSLPSTLSLANYISALKIGKFYAFFSNTLYVTFFGLILGVGVATLAGYAFGQIRFWGREPLFYMFLLGLTLPSQTVIIPVFYLLKSMGLINTLWGVILASVGMGLSFGVFLMRNTFKGLPKELKESAYMDGAGEWRTFLWVMLPLAKPALVALVIFTFNGLWNEYLLPLVVLIKPDKFTIAVGLTAFQSEQYTNYSIIFAGAVISMIPSIILYLIFQRQFIEGLLSGAQKG
ncbi:carbohydrate ABC transporter permease [Paenibacillus cremeus]|uniref:Carbohydrate ABC transporter permease n=1 Tax=Paenibacillus cremeus TaxID=2163881 RepID=A0A559KEA3_9BACL|nr:carbohydrate ABC transporter permease [Paenibacillus cremeus]TVY10448.1 carbohydrate ABC transporter permease [Paenibacillus cremeus]